MKYHVTLQMILPDREKHSGSAWHMPPFSRVEVGEANIHAYLPIEAVSEASAEYGALELVNIFAPSHNGMGMLIGKWKVCAIIAQDEDRTRSSDDAFATGA